MADTIRHAAVALLVLLAAPARAEPAPRDFTATYGVAFLGLPVGEATLTLGQDPGRYKLELRAGLRGLAGFFVSGEGTATVVGRLTRGSVSPAEFAVESRYAGKPIRVALRLEGGRVREATVEPEPTPRPDRVPVTEADKVGVADPLSGLLLPLNKAGLDPGLCERRIPVFDGVIRADLVLSRGALVTVTDGPYRGPALDCRVRWLPVAGYRTGGPTVRRMAENDELRVRLAPVPGGDLLAPLAISVATGWGTVEIGARAWGTAPAGAPSGSGVRLSLPQAR